MKPPTPDFVWYSAESTRLGLKSPRCPFQNVNTCPRYYFSLSLLGEHGCTKIEKSEDDRLTAFWKNHPLAPQTAEQDTGIGSTEKGICAYHNFCPEVAYNRFGIFATYFAPHTDEMDAGFAHQRLADEGVPADDPRWAWRSLIPQHYAECPLYSQLSHGLREILARAPTPPTSTSLRAPARFDVFISHASEDTEGFVRDLAATLTRLGLKVWFDETTLTLGDSLGAKIDQGLACSDYGVVVLSHSFFNISKSWTKAELGALLAREMQGRKVILPVRHGLTQADVAKYSPLLADKLSTLTDKGVEAVAAEIFKVVHPHGTMPPSPSPAGTQAVRREPDPRESGDALNEQLRGFSRLAPLLYKLDDTIEGEDARRFLCAMQRFFHAGNLLMQDIDQDLLIATDNLLRVLAASGDVPYQFGKLATAAHHLDTFRKRVGFGFQLSPLAGGRELWQELRLLHGSLCSQLDADLDLPDCDLLVFRLNTALLEYGASQHAPKNPHPMIGRNLHDALRKYLEYALAHHLNTTLPDPLDTIGTSDMKEHCRIAWEHCEDGDTLTFR
jgi:hypothetical protein